MPRPVGSSNPRNARPVGGASDRPVRAVGSDATSASSELSAPLGAPATPATLMSTGLRVYSSRRRRMFEKATPRVGQRVMFDIDFYDDRTKVAVTPSSVRVKLETPTGIDSEVALSEDPARMGHFTGSAVPAVQGDWKFTVVYGGSNEVLDSGRFYVERLANAAS